VKLVLQRRKRDAYDHDIEHHHDLSGARHSQDKPLPLPGRRTQSHDSTLPHQTGKRAILVWRASAVTRTANGLAGANPVKAPLV
jgi:hypothetical protein